MKKSILLLTLLSILMLAACNTTEPVKDEEQPTTSTNKEENSVQNDDQDATEEKNEENQNNEQSTNTNQEESNTGTEEKTHSITYNSNGKEITDSTTLIESPQQNYSMELLNGFTLTAEEPGRDMLLLNDNDAISMRIEVFNTDIAFDELLANTKDSALAIAPNGQYEELDLSNLELDKGIKNIATFNVQLENETISTVLFNKNNKYIRLTIFDDKSDLKDALLKMGLTIQ